MGGVALSESTRFQDLPSRRLSFLLTGAVGDNFGCDWTFTIPGDMFAKARLVAMSIAIQSAATYHDLATNEGYWFRLTRGGQRPLNNIPSGDPIEKAAQNSTAINESFWLFPWSHLSFLPEIYAGDDFLWSGPVGDENASETATVAISVAFADLEYQ